MDAIDRLCARLDRRHRLETALQRALPAAAVAGLVGATALAVVRLAVPGAGWLAPAVVAAALLAPLPLVIRPLTARTPRWRLTGEADALADADGLVMALAEHPDPAWSEQAAARVAAVVPPPVRAPGLPAALAGLALLAGAWCLPQAVPPTPPPPVADGALRGADAALERLAAEGLATPEALEALAERLETVREAVAARGLDQQGWAALDALERDLGTARAAAADRLADALAKAEALAALPPGGDAAAAAADLAAALAELQAQAPGLAPPLPAGVAGEALQRLARQALAGGNLDEAQRRALERLGLDPAGQAQPGDAAEAQHLAARLAGELAQAGAQAGAEDGPQGPGGPGPGGGHAQLDWRTVQRVESGFRDRLEAGVPLRPEAGAPLSTQARAPRADEQGQTAGAPAPLQAHDAAAVGNRAAVVAPRHRAAVAGYFAAGATP